MPMIFIMSAMQLVQDVHDVCEFVLSMMPMAHDANDVRDAIMSTMSMLHPCGGQHQKLELQVKFDIEWDRGLHGWCFSLGKKTVSVHENPFPLATTD